MIGTPIHECYPPENLDLQNEIATHHLVVSQVPVLRYAAQDYRSNRNFFPERNKTMSALTDATVIIEAGETSGTLIQAQAAIAQGRKLFILDSCFENTAITWPAKYERQGAVRVRDFDQILRELSVSADAAKMATASPPRMQQVTALEVGDHSYLSLPEDECYFYGDYTAPGGYTVSATNQLIINFK